MSAGPYAPRDGAGRAPTPVPEARPGSGRDRPEGAAPGAAGRTARQPGVALDPRPRGATRVPHPDDPAFDPRRPARIGRGATALLVVACVLGTLQAAAMIAVEARRWWVADREVVRLEREVAALHAEAADLALIAGRGDDERFREHLARRQGYVFPDEVRYVIAVPDAPAPTPEPATPAAP